MKTTNVFFAHNSTSIKENDYKQFISKVDKEQIRTNKADIEWLKENGVGGGNVNLDNYYDKQETDNLILDVKKLTTGIAFAVRYNDWLLIDGEYVYQLNHNLAIALQSFSVGFYVEHISAMFEYKYLSEDSILIYSDSPTNLTVVVKQSVEASTTVPKEVLDKIDANTNNLIACNSEVLENAAKINSNTLDINILKARPEIDMSNYYTKENVYNKAEVYNSSEIYTKTEVDNKLKENASFETNWGDISEEVIAVSQAKGSGDILNTYTGISGQIIVDIESNSLRIMDGVTPGGHEVSGGSDLANYYTKMQTDNLLTGKVEKKSGHTLIPEQKLLLIENHELDISSNTVNINNNKEAIKTLNARVDETFTSVSNGKNLIETAITDKGGTVSKEDQVATFEELATGVNTITTADTVGKQIILDAILFKMPELKDQLTVDNTWEQYAYYIKLIGPKNITVEDKVSLVTEALDNKLLTRSEVRITDKVPMSNGLEERVTLTAMSPTKILSNSVALVVLTPIE